MYASPDLCKILFASPHPNLYSSGCMPRRIDKGMKMIFLAVGVSPSFTSQGGFSPNSYIFTFYSTNLIILLPVSNIVKKVLVT